MKKILMFMAIMIAVVVQANAQTTNNVYNGANYSVIIEEVVPVKGMTAKQMYNNALLWVNNNFSSPKSVIQSREESLGLITIHLCTQNKSGSWLDATLKLQFKDGRYKYTYDNIWLRWDSDLKSLGAQDEPYGKWITHITDNAKANWKSDLLDDLRPYIMSMKSGINSTENDW